MHINEVSKLFVEANINKQKTLNHKVNRFQKYVRYPIDKKTYKSEYCLLLFINHPKTIPMIKQPIKFAIKVDHGKLLLSAMKSFEIA